MRSGWGSRITGYRLYRATYCARTDPLPLLPSGPGGVGGGASRRTPHILMITLRTGRAKSQKSFLVGREKVSTGQKSNASGAKALIAVTSYGPTKVVP